MKKFVWNAVTENDWNVLYRSPYIDDTGKVIRVFPGTDEYAEVVRLRYDGLVETGFINPACMTMSKMELQRDRDSIILALWKDGKIVGTLTLNTITPEFPALAMELDKGVSIDRPFFRAADTLEFTKLVVEPGARSMKLTLNFMIASCLLAKLLGKNHFWQVSRNVQKDIFHRERLGFSYADNFQFIDRSLNNMDSRVGYLFLPDILKAPKLLAGLRRPLQEILDLDLSAAPAHGTEKRP
jgi:hypothetical protein